MRALLLALSFISTSALAVPYTFTGTGFELLRDQNRSIVCYSTMPVNCDVNPGDYTLFNYSTNPATVTTITIDEPIEGPMIVSEICNLLPSSIGFSCYAKCPTGKVVAQVLTCTAVEIENGAYLGSGFRSDAGTLHCQATSSNFEVQMFAKARCE